MFNDSPEGGASKEPVGTPYGQLRPVDQQFLCSAICQCGRTPDPGKDGRQLKQQCVSRNLKAWDTAQQGRSIYKPEVNYDMTQAPPRPIMASQVSDMGPQAHSWLPGWIKKHWGDEDAGRPPFKAGDGMVRRPDVVIVKDPQQAPTQDNIYQVVEIKFPGDDFSRDQAFDYKRIAGNEGNFVPLRSSSCACESEQERQPFNAPYTAPARALETSNQRYDSSSEPAADGVLNTIGYGLVGVLVFFGLATPAGA